MSEKIRSLSDTGPRRSRSAGGSRPLVIALALIAVPLIVALAEAATFHARNRNNGSVVSSGVKREYLLHIPRSYDGRRPVPLVISMHGAGGWPALQRDLSGWNRLADKEGFIVVYPSGRRGSGPRIWMISRRDEVRFIQDLVDDLERRYAIDPTRIYANGLSNGAGMSFALSCKLVDRIAAVGLVASAQTMPWEWCSETQPVPMIAFHGTADPVTPYHGGTTWVAPVAFPDIETWTARWARRNQCASQPDETRIGSDVLRRAYGNCATGADVELYTIEDGGHTWPGGDPLPEWFLGRTSGTVDATERMWDFFRNHPLERRIR